MSYIIKHDFDQPIPYYVRLVDSEKFEELYCPKFATRFETREKAQEFIDTYSSVAEYSKVVDAATAIEEYDKWVESGTVRGTRKCINTTVSRPYNGESLDEVIDWWIYQKHNDNEIKYEHYETWPGLYSITKHLVEVGAYHNNDYSELFITFLIRTSKDGEFSVFESELSKVMNRVTYKDDEGYLIFPILDHYLSEHGNSVSLLIHPETTKVKIGRGRYSSGDEFATLEGAFNYMKKERYYE
jgi:adenosine deaminase